MAEKTREEFLAEFAKNIFDETYFSTFSNDDIFIDAAKFLKDNGLPASALDSELKKLQQKYKYSRPNAKDNLFDIIDDEYGRDETRRTRNLFGFDIDSEFKTRKEAREEEKAAEVAKEAEAIKEAEGLEEAEVVEDQPTDPVEPKADVQATPKDPAQVEQGPNLENPAGLAAMADNLGRGVRDPRIKSIAANQRRNMEKSLNAQAARKIDEDIAKQRRADRTQKIFDDRDADLKEAWAQSRTGRRTGLTFDELDAETQAEMRNRYNDSREAGAYSDEKWDAYKKSLGVPVYDENGLVGYESSKKFEEDMGGQQIRMNTDQPNRAQIRERRNNAMLDDIRSEIKETGKHPFGEGPILGTDHAREVELSKKYGGDMAGLKKAARDVRDNPFNKANYAEAFMPADFNQPKPLPPTASPVSSFEPSQKMVSQDMLDRNNQEVNSVLDSVPFPRPRSPQAPKPKPRNPITTLPFSLEQPVSKQPTRTRASGDIDARKTSMTLDDLDLPTKIVNKLNLKPTYPFIGG